MGFMQNGLAVVAKSGSTAVACGEIGGFWWRLGLMPGKDRSRFLKQIGRADIIMRSLKRLADRDIRPAGGIKS
jgi:hypothetical protein